jgi:hypothetical protein
MYSDLREKHLAALLKAVGIQAFPVLISSHTTVDTDVPSPGQFNHVISVVGNPVKGERDSGPKPNAIPL